MQCMFSSRKAVFEINLEHRNTECDYSAAYVILKTNSPSKLEGYGMTFTIGRGNDIVSPSRWFSLAFYC
jgi:hypothetical protein